MLLTFGLLIAGLTLLTAGAEFFVRGSSSLAARLGVRPLVIGLTVAAFGTSAPELFVSVKSALAGYPGITVGNVIGSNIANVALILGISALITPLSVHLKVIRRDTPFMLLISTIACVMLWNRDIARIEAVVLLLLFFCYLTATAVLSLRERTTEARSGQDLARYGKIPLLLLYIAGGLLALLYGANLAVDTGAEIARFFGVNETVIGISIVAVGTSLPELAASVMAALKKEADIAIGNIVGSNVFNIGLVLGTAGAICPFSVPDLRAIDIGIMLFLSALLFPFLRTGFTLNRIEGAILLLTYAAYMVFLWA